MRDPWVMRDPNGDGWCMYFTARAPGIAEPNAGGAIGFATSPDLLTWTLQPPVFTGGYGQFEVPQVFAAEGRWYCLFCTDAGHWSKAQVDATPGGASTGTHTLISDTGPHGPWRIQPGPFLDGELPCRRYAARIVATDDRRAILGFRDTGGDGEFVVFVGPSGCGKSTLLRMISGLEDNTSGTIEIDGRVVNDLPPKERGIAMVFQTYAIFPHMTVRENVAFGLTINKVDRATEAKTLAESARILQMEHLLDRKPSQLSGGQPSESPSAVPSCATSRFSCSTNRSPTSTPLCAWTCGWKSASSIRT